MKNILKIAIIFLALTTLKVYSQWPGSFYSFELKDIDGKNIDSLNTDFSFTYDMSNPYLLGIKMCDDGKTWRFYKGDKNLYISNTLTVTKKSTGESMVFDFPPPMSGGKEKYYRNFYTGVFTFKSGSYKILLPESDSDWDNLKEIKICPLSYMNAVYYDISKFQK